MQDHHWVQQWVRWVSMCCQVVNTINEKTKDFPGMKVPVKVEVDTETKKFTVEVGIPPTALLWQRRQG